MNQLAQKKTLLGMLVAALMCVALLAVAAPQDAYAAQGWNKDSKGYWYECDNKGHYYKSGWKYIEDSYSNAYDVSSPNYGGVAGGTGGGSSSNWYYFQSNGYAKTGWLKSGKYWYYLDPEMACDVPEYINSKPYYFDKSGHMITGWYYDKGQGRGATGWIYANKSGVLATGWKKISGKWYHFDVNLGIKANNAPVYSYGGLKVIDGKTYYFDKKSTAMVTGWQKIDGKWYYFAKSGAMQKNKWIGNYWLGSDGVMVTDSWVDNGKYYVDKNGKWVKGKTK